jgi:hypothetical protein
VVEAVSWVGLVQGQFREGTPVAFKAGPRIDPEKAAAPRSRSSQSSVGSAMMERCGAGADASTRDRQWIDVG